MCEITLKRRPGVSDRLLKHMAIARSGVYAYRREELPSLGITSIPNEYAEKVLFGVYRPATVLASAAPLFARLPVTLEHRGKLTPENVDLNMGGYTGDKVDPVFDPNTKELFLISSMTLASAELIDAYDEGIREVSPGYTPKVIWAKGKHNDEEYQLMVTNISDVNHLAMVQKARGGYATCIFDSEGGNSMKERKFLSGLWRFLKRKAAGAEDTDLGAARRILMEIAEKKDAMSDEEIAAKVDEVQGLATDLPDSEEKGKLVRFLEDFKQSKQMDPQAVKEAAEMIAGLFEELDTSAMAEVTGVGTEPGEEPKPEEPKPDEEPKPEEKPVEEPKPDEAKPEDGQAGSTSLTKPAQYVPGLENIGEDGCSDEDIAGFLASLKGKKVSPKQAVYILQELLAHEEEKPAEKPAELKPEEKPVEESADPKPADSPKPEEKPAEEPKPEEEPAQDSFGFNAELKPDGEHSKKSLASFFSENFGTRR